MSEYFLRSSRLGFRPWSDEDVELARGLWGDLEVTRWIGGPFTEEQVKDRLAKEISTMNSDGLQYWPIFLLSPGEHIGCCGLKPYKPKEQIFELGFHIRTAHWSKGYASEAARAVMNYAFTELDARALFAGHHPNNAVSRRIVQKLGCRYTHDEFYPPTGLGHPSYLLTAEEYARGASG